MSGCSTHLRYKEKKGELAIVAGLHGTNSLQILSRWVGPINLIGCSIATQNFPSDIDSRKLLTLLLQELQVQSSSFTNIYALFFFYTKYSFIKNVTTKKILKCIWRTSFKYTVAWKFDSENHMVHRLPTIPTVRTFLRPTSTIMPT